jgi:hypothetical protein
LSSLAIGVLLGLGAAAAFEISYVLLTTQARSMEVADRPNASFFVQLVRQRRWLMAMGLSGVAFGLEIAALKYTSLLVVQPLLAVGLVGLVLIARVYLRESVGSRQLVGVIFVAGGATLVIAGAPPGTASLPFNAPSVVVVVLLIAVLGFPQVSDRGTRWRLVAAAAAGDTLVALGANTAAAAWPGDIALAVVSVAAVALFGLTSTTSESAALQCLPASRVGPTVSAAQTTLPVLIIALLGHNRWSRAPAGGALLSCGVVLVALGAYLLSHRRAAFSAEPERAQATHELPATPDKARRAARREPRPGAPGPDPTR